MAKKLPTLSKVLLVAARQVSPATPFPQQQIAQIGALGVGCISFASFCCFSSNLAEETCGCCRGNLVCEEISRVLQGLEEFLESFEEFCRVLQIFADFWRGLAEFGKWMAAMQVATQVTTKRLFNIMSGGQALMRSVYYSRQTSTKFLWQKQKEVFSMIGSVSRRWSSSSSVAEGAVSSTEASSSAAPPAVDADTKSYGGVQEDHHKVASSSHEEHDNKGDDQERLTDVGYDMSKVSKPSGDE